MILSGNPISGTAHVRRTGTFRDNGDFSTDGTFNLVHTDEADSQADEVIVNLYERMSARSADRLLASVTEVDGRPDFIAGGPYPQFID